MKPENSPCGTKSLTERLSQLIMENYSGAKFEQLDLAKTQTQLDILAELEEVSFNCAYKPNTHVFVEDANKFFGVICDQYLPSHQQQTNSIWNHYIKTLQKKVNVEASTYVSDNHLKEEEAPMRNRHA